MKYILTNRKYFKIGLFVVVGAVFLFGIFQYIGPSLRKYFAANPAVQITLTPTKANLKTNEEFQISMQIVDGNVSAIDLSLEYDSDKLAYSKEYEPTNSGFIPLDPDYFDTPWLETTTDTTTGKKKLRMVVLAKSDATKPTPTPPYAIQFGLRFKALTAGIATVKILPETKIAGQDGSGPATNFDFTPDLTTSVNISESNTCVCTNDLVSTDNCDTGFAPICSADNANQCACAEIVDFPTDTPTPTPTPATEVSETPTPTPTVVAGTVTPTSPITPPLTISPPSDLIADVKLNMKIRFQGVVTEPIDQFREQDVKVTFLSNDKQFKKEATVQFNADGGGIWIGSQELIGVPIGKSFSVLLKGPKHLQKKICESDPKEPIPGGYICKTGNITLTEGDNDFDFSDVVNLAGDIPIQNGIVDSMDIIFIRQNFGSQDSEKLSKGDLNMDGIIDTQDYSLVIAALAFKYDDN